MLEEASIHVFDSHLHIIDSRFPLTVNQGYLPDIFSVEDYHLRTSNLAVIGGAVVSASFQGFDQTYLLEALRNLGPGFVGVAQLPATVSDNEILALNNAGVCAVRFNIRRGGPEVLDYLETLAWRAFEIAGWHTELYIDSRGLPALFPLLSSLPRVSIDHLGLSHDGFATLLQLVERGIYVKASGFGRVDLNVAQTLRAICTINPHALLFGTDLPGTRALRPFQESDVSIVLETLGEEIGKLVLCENALSFYHSRL